MLDPSRDSRPTVSRRARRSQGRQLEATEVFELPLDGLFGDLAAGVGSISLPEEFTHVPGATQLSVVRGWRRGLENARERALVILYRETVGATSLPLPEKLIRFRAICAQHGEDCPTDIARLLQQY
jgi:hypothetical protein